MYLELLEQPYKANVRVLDPDTDRVEVIPPTKAASRIVGARLVAPGEVFHLAHEGFNPLAWKLDCGLTDTSTTRIVVHYLHADSRRALKHVRTAASQVLQ
eukprot:6213050-Pleurochrysis_carterae.AAC.3